MSLLQPGEEFPALPVQIADGDALQLPDALAGHYGVVLFYRGSWCPYCNAQLRAFERAHDALAEVDAAVVALSVDDADTTRALVEKHRLRFPVGHSADAPKIAAATGAFVDGQRGHLESTGFVLDPTGAVVVSVYSSGLIRYLRSHAA